MGCGDHRAGSQGAGSGAQPPKSPQPQGLCWRWPWPEASPTAPSAPQTAARARNMGFHPFPVPFSWGCVVIHPPGTTAPPAHRRRLGTRRYPGERRGRVRAGRSLPRAGFLLRSQKARFPRPQCAGIELAQPQCPPGIPGGTAAGRAPCTGEPQGVHGAVVLSRGWWGSEDALSPVPSPGGAVPVPTARERWRAPARPRELAGNWGNRGGKGEPRLRAVSLPPRRAFLRALITPPFGLTPRIKRYRLAIATARQLKEINKSE